jgi:hypothetical protein
MKFGQLMEVHHSGLYVTERHEAWLKANPNAKYSRKALEFAINQLRSPQRDRTQSFSASGIGGCPRAAQFAFLGMPQKPITDGRTVQIFHNGSHMHLRWQMAGLTEGWLAEAEVFASSARFMLKGTLDGILDNGDGLELKSINSYGYSQVCQHGGKKEHLAQIDAYFLMFPEIRAFSLIYENKDTQDYKEIRVQRDSARINALREHLDELVAKTGHQKLFEMRDDCWQGEGYAFRFCPYSAICKAQGSWPVSHAG